MQGLRFDAANNLVYGFGNGGRIFFKNSTPASKWSASQTVNLPSDIITDIAIDSANSNNLYAVASSLLFQGSRNGAWVMKSINIGPATSLVDRIIQSNTNPAAWLAWNGRIGAGNLYLTEDNMLTWREIVLPAGTFNSIYLSASDEIWIGGHDSLLNPVLYYLNNFLGAWQRRGSIPIVQSNAKVKSINIIAGKLYVGLEDIYGNTFNAANSNYLFRSSDNGVSFIRLTVTVPTLPFLDTHVKITSGNINQVYLVSGSLVFRSSNAGASWVEISPPNNRAGGGFAYQSPWNGNHIYIASVFRGGVMFSSDLGVTWKTDNAGLRNSSPNLINTSKNVSKPDELITASIRGEGVFVSQNAGISWRETTANGVDHPWIDEVVISPLDPNRIWAIADVGNLYASNDAGQSWQKQFDTRAPTGFRYGSIYAMATAPSNRSIIYALKNGFGIFKSVDSGNSWLYLNNSGVDYSYSITVHPNNANIVMSGYNPKPSEHFAKLMRSADGGQNWVESKRFVGATSASSVQFAVGGMQMYAGVTGNQGGQVWLSADSGISWQQGQRSLNFINVRHMVQDPNNANHLFALLWGGGIYESANGGINWSRLVGLDALSDSISALVIDSNNSNILYAGDRLSNKIFKSGDGGVSWIQYTVVNAQNRITDLAITPDGSTLYAAALGFAGPFSGDTVRINLLNATQVSISSGMNGVPLSMVAQDNNRLIAAGHGHFVFRSLDKGATWAQLTVSPLHDANFGFFRVVKAPANANVIYLVGGDDRAANFTRNGVPTSIMHTLWRSSDGGNTWVNLNLNHGAALRDLAVSANGMTLVAVGMNNQIRISEDGGATWAASSMPFSMAASVKITGVKSISVGMLGGGVRTANWVNPAVLNWSAANTLSAPVSNIQIVTHPTNVNIAYATAYPGGVYRTMDGGLNWIELNDGLPTVDVLDPNRQGYYRLAIDPANGNRLLLGLYGKGIFVTDTVNDIIWRPVNGSQNELAGIKLADVLIQGNSWWVGSEQGLWLSTNGGISWARDDAQITVPDIRTLAVGKFNSILAGTRGYEVFMRDVAPLFGWFQLAPFGNYGVFWKQWNRNLYQFSTLLFDKSNANTIYLGSFPAGMYKSLDNGITWHEHNIGWGNDGVFSLVQPVSANPNVIMAGTYNGIKISRDGGNTWHTSSTGMPPEQWVFSIVLDPFDPTEKTIYVATKNGVGLGAGDPVKGVFGSVLKSIDAGTTWSAITTGLDIGQEFYRIIADPNPGMRGTLYLATQRSGVWITRNGGLTWANWSTGMPAGINAATNGNNVAATMDISVDGQYLYFGALGSGIWRRPTASHVDVTKVVADTSLIDLQWNAATPHNQVQNLVLSNLGDLPIVVSSLTLSGNAAVFQMNYSACGANIAILDSCVATVSLAPALAPGSYSAQLSSGTGVLTQLTATVILDSDLDGVPDAQDAFPNDPAASVDTDGDGYPDVWNANATAAQIATSALSLDAFPNDPSKWQTTASPAQLMGLSIGDVNGNGSGDFAVLGKRKSTGRYVIRVKDVKTVPALIREIGLNGAYKPVQMVRLPDMNGNGSREIAVLEVDPVTGLNRQIQVKDSRTGAKIVNIPLKPSVKPHMLVALPDVNGNGSADLALSEVDAITGKNVQIQVKDGRTGALIQNIRVSTSVKPHMLISLGLINGKPALALSEVHVTTGKNVQVQVKNAFTGAKIVNIRVKGSVKPHMLVALPDVNGNGSPDIALSEVDAVTGRNVQIQVKDGKTGALIRNVRVNTSVKPHKLVSVGNINGAPALALSEVYATTGKMVQIQVKNARTGAKIRNVAVNRNYKPSDLIVLADINGNGAPELALSEVNASTGLNVQVQVKDARTGAKIRNIPMNPNYTPLSMSRILDSNGNGVAEIGLLEVNAAGNVQIQVKDPLTGSKVVNLPYPNF